MTRLVVRAILCLAWAAAAVPARADEPAKGPVAVTVADPKVTTDDLELLVRPLTKAELTVEADAWLQLVHSKVAEISQAEIAAGKAKAEEEKNKALTQAAKLREERTQLIDRLNVVLDALKTKGGKIDEYDLYAKAVSGINVNVTDAHATWTTITNWLKSGEGGIRYLKNILLFVATLVVFRILSSAAGKITERTMGAFKNVSSLLRDFVVNVVRKVVMFVGFVIALSMLEVNIGPFLAAMGAAGFVIGFALQGTLSNFAAGVMILLYRPYDLRDKVTVAGATGLVTSMTLVSTTITNADGNLVIIPNSAIWGGTITNFHTEAAAR